MSVPRRPLTSWSALAACAMALPFAGAAQTPEQRLFEWATPPFGQEVYEARRDRLVDVLGARPGVVVALSGHGLSHGDTFRQQDDFSYLVGLELPTSVLVLGGPAGSGVLFAPARDPRFESASRPNDFPGRPIADDPAVVAWMGGARVRPLAAAGPFLDSVAVSGTPVYLASGDDRALPPASVPLHASEAEVTGSVRHVLRRLQGSDVRRGFPLMAAVRAVKGTEEIGTMERAARITSRAIVKASREIAPGVTERQLEGAFLDACRSDGSQRPPFFPIIKSGPNSLWPWRVLASHYDRRNRAMEAGDLVILDVGCELDGYVSDVGRTFPVSGEFTDRQREVLSMEVAVSDRIIEAVRPGVTLADLQEVARQAIPDQAQPYMQVGLFFGHHLGLSTGDPVDTSAPLAPGMIFTVEPWYYNHDEGISVFTEDEVLVTEGGARNLTAMLPRRPADLERLMSAGIVSGLTVDPDQPPPPSDLDALVDQYVAAWNEPSRAGRMEMLEEVWAEAGRYLDPSAHTRGREALADHIGGFQRGMSGPSIQRSGPVIGTGAHITFPWEITG
ncbi:MAG: M24 family metallopeptidase, partial [Gemmatimonadetes bacterium]|nr:M24 family metallopeptidase [Gemmatimonadota bacterium]